MTDIEIREMAKKSAEWIISSEGQKALSEVFGQANKTIEELKKVINISWDKWDRIVRKPFHI